MRAWRSTIDFQMAISRFPCEWDERKISFWCAVVRVSATMSVVLENIQIHKILWRQFISLLLLLLLCALRFNVQRKIYFC